MHLAGQGCVGSSGQGHVTRSCLMIRVLGWQVGCPRGVTNGHRALLVGQSAGGEGWLLK